MLKNDLLDKFSDRFNAALQDAGLTENDGRSISRINADIGKRYNLSGKMIGYLRSGERHVSTSTGMLIAKDLGVNFEWLMLGNGPKNPLSESDQRLLDDLLQASDESKQAIRVLISMKNKQYN